MGNNESTGSSAVTVDETANVPKCATNSMESPDSLVTEGDINRRRGGYETTGLIE